MEAQGQSLGEPPILVTAAFPGGTCQVNESIQMMIRVSSKQWQKGTAEGKQADQRTQAPSIARESKKPKHIEKKKQE